MSDAAIISITVDRDAPQPLFQQLYEALRRRIASGRIKEQAALPASRSFAQELGVSRATVTLAYDQLIAEGYLESRRGSGVFVCKLEAIVPCTPPRAMSKLPGTEPESHLNLVNSPSYSTNERSNHDTRARPFDPGIPDMRLFPYKEWGRCVARVARTATAAMVNDGDRFGDPELRAALARHLAQWRAINVSPEQIIITAGAGDALELTIRSTTQKGDIIALENPGYLPLRRFALSLGLDPHWLAVDQEGALLPQILPGNASPILSVLTPSHQFPLGGTMGTGRRAAFLARAEQSGGWIVEDDFDSEFRYAGQPIPAMAGLATGMAPSQSRVIYVGSLAKIFSKGLRLGFMVVPEKLVDIFAATLVAYGHKVSLAAQRPLANFIDDGSFHRHIRRMRRIYGARRRAFLGLLQSEFGSLISPKTAPAGLQIAITLPQSWNDVALSEAAQAQGLNCPPLSRYYAKGPTTPGLLMGFSAFSEDEMRAPMARLGKIISATHNNF